MNTAIQILTYEEGFNSKVYIDSEGYPTVGYGLRIGAKRQPLSEFNDFPPMPQHVAAMWMGDIVNKIEHELLKKPIGSIYAGLDYNRQAVLTCMAYQLGISGMLKFKKTLDFIRKGEYTDASIEMLRSKWAKQTPNRAQRMAQIILTGEIQELY